MILTGAERKGQGVDVAEFRPQGAIHSRPLTLASHLRATNSIENGSAGTADSGRKLPSLFWQVAVLKLRRQGREVEDGWSNLLTKQRLCLVAG